ncbi:MAG: RNA polymerase sigma factor [Clostridiales bacterium]|nr:RNA polymerase sigma factor [Clostridiales bacterium]
MDANKANLFEQLYNENFVKVYRLAHGLVKNSFDAEEITQESFLRAFRFYDSFREDSSFFTWIYRITLNVANDYLKKKEKMAVQSLEDAGYVIDEIIDHAQTFDPEMEYLEHEAKAMCLHSVTECLAGDQRKIFCLAVTLGLPQKTVAEILDSSVGAVKTALYRAKKRWFGYMENRCSLINKSNPCHCKQWVKFGLSQGWFSPDEARDIIITPNPVLVNEVLDLRSLRELYKTLYSESDTENIAERIKSGIKKKEWEIFS